MRLSTSIATAPALVLSGRSSAGGFGAGRVGAGAQRTGAGGVTGGVNGTLVDSSLIDANRLEADMAGAVNTANVPAPPSKPIPTAAPTIPTAAPAVPSATTDPSAVNGSAKKPSKPSE